MIVKCPECNSKGSIPDDYAEKMVRCPKCAVDFTAQPDESGGSWYYALEHEKIGPVEQDRLIELADGQVLSAETLIWKKGMAEWQPMAEVFPELAKTEGGLPEDGQCPECRGRFDQTQLMDHQGRQVCEGCKLELLHRTGRSRAEGAGGLPYANVGSRVAAWIIDMLFMLSLGGMLEGVSRKLFPASYAAGDLNAIVVLTVVVNILTGMFYVVYFLGRYGATPGKMFYRLKIVEAGGSDIDYGQAFGRYCGKFIIGILTFFLSYLPLFFDGQRRTLHDRLSNTRVISLEA